MSILTETWHTGYLGGVDSESALRFLKFWPKIYFWASLGQKSQSCLFCLKIGTHGNSRMLILIPALVFSIFNSKSIFGQSWAKKKHLKIGTYGISSISVLVPTLVFWILKPKSIFREELGPGSGIACFGWCSYTSYFEGADLFHLKSVTGEDNKEAM